MPDAEFAWYHMLLLLPMLGCCIYISFMVVDILIFGPLKELIRNRERVELIHCALKQRPDKWHRPIELMVMLDQKKLSIDTEREFLKLMEHATQRFGWERAERPDPFLAKHGRPLETCFRISRAATKTAAA